MINFILRLLGWRCCGEWTQWEVRSQNYSRPVRYSDGNVYLAGEKRLEYTQKWQERRCTMCGKIQQKPLEY
jgi:hypothetical protein